MPPERFFGEERSEQPPTVAEIGFLHNYLTNPALFFIDKETALILKPENVSRILGISLSRSDESQVILGDLIAREQIRYCSNLPSLYQDINGVSFLSVLEYVTRQRGGKISENGEFSRDEGQIVLQKDLMREILGQIPNWRKGVRDHIVPSAAFTTFSKSMATLTGPTPPGTGV